MSQSQPNSRWYEDYPAINALLQYGETLDLESQKNLGRLMRLLLKQFETEIRHAQESAVYDGPALLNHLKLSMHRNRWYDNVPELHGHVDTLMFLPRDILCEIDRRCTLLMENQTGDACPDEAASAAQVHCS